MAPVVVVSSPSSISEEAEGRLAPSTTTSPDNPTRVFLRQATATIVTDPYDPYYDGDNGAHLTGGAIAGIVIGSIAGFLLLLWIVRACINLQYPEFWGNTMEPTHEKVIPVRGHRHHHHHRHHRHGSGHHHHHHHRRSRSGSHSHRTSPHRVTTRTTVLPVPPQAVYHHETRPVVEGRTYRTYY